MVPEKKDLQKEFSKPPQGCPKRAQGEVLPNVVYCSIQAIIEKYDDFIALGKVIERSTKTEFQKKSVYFRLIIMIFCAIFQTNFQQMEEILTYHDNPQLYAFLNKFSKEPSICQEELSRTKDHFWLFWEDIKKLAFEIKECYHRIFQNVADREYIEFLKEENRRDNYQVAKMLEGINFSKYYPEEIIPETSKYPKPLLLKACFYGAINQVNGTAHVAQILLERVEGKRGEYRDVAYALGFYFGVPSLSTLYNFKATLSQDLLFQLMSDNLEYLIKDGIVDPSALIIDSTELYARKDDPDIVETQTKRGNLGKCHKFHLIGDPNKIPLWVDWSPGNDPDVSGVRFLKDPLIRIKKMAENCGKKLDYVTADAGYDSIDFREFIIHELGAIPLIDINPRDNNELKEIKKRLENIKELLRKGWGKKSLNKGHKKMLRYQAFQEMEALEKLLYECLGSALPSTKIIARNLLNVGVHNFTELFKRRTTIEALIGDAKETYCLLGKTNNKLIIMGQERVTVEVLLLFIGLQFKAMTHYRLTKSQNNLLKNLYWVNISNIIINYEEHAFPTNY